VFQLTFSNPLNPQAYGVPAVSLSDFIWRGTPTPLVDPQRVSVGGGWRQNGDGSAYKNLPDHTECELSLRIPGVDHYNIVPAVQKVRLDIRSLRFKGSLDVMRDQRVTNPSSSSPEPYVGSSTPPLAD
jgi:hypothetical protein